MTSGTSNLLAVGAALLLAGCATRGALDFACDQFAPVELPAGVVVGSIIQDQGKEARGLLSSEQALTRVEADIACARSDPLMRAMLATTGRCGTPAIATRANRLLLLSGGGQWGAFGAGFLDRLDAGGKLPEFTTITGISTGAMQALLLGDDRPGKFGRLAAEYKIATESDIVDRNSKAVALITGSVAGLAPLVGKIERALCSDAVIAEAQSPETADCLLVRLADGSGPAVIVGFVESESGKMMVVSLNELARTYAAKSLIGQTPAVRLRHARTCVTAAAVASAAMPGFYQQVRVSYFGTNGQRVRKTLLDGGVRQSVFLPAVSAALRQAEAATTGGAASGELYVVRNGPTTGKLESEANGNRGVLSTALRSYDIVVNQLEVGSLAALRVEYPELPIKLATADGLATESCLAKRDPERMFDPDFMTCLQTVGVSKADRADPWLAIARADKDTAQ